VADVDNPIGIGFGVFTEYPADGFSDEEFFVSYIFADNVVEQVFVGILFIFELK